MEKEGYGPASTRSPTSILYTPVNKPPLLSVPRVFCPYDAITSINLVSAKMSRNFHLRTHNAHEDHLRQEKLLPV